MRTSLSLLALGLVVSSNLASARVLSRPALARTIAAVKTFNGVIERESDLTKLRCRNQTARKTDIDETLASFSSQVSELNRQVATITRDRESHQEALTTAKSIIAQKLSDIATLDGRIRNLGSDSDRERELRAEKLSKTNEKARKVAAQVAGQSAFDAWEARGNNARILDGAHDKLRQNPNAVLNANETAAIAYESAFNTADNALTVAIQVLTTRLAAIETELDGIAVADNRSLEQLRSERQTALDALRDNERIRDREAPLVAGYDRQLRQIRARIAVLTGVRGAEPINTDCTLLLQVQ